jgi:hypothetical protein
MNIEHSMTVPKGSEGRRTRRFLAQCALSVLTMGIVLCTVNSRAQTNTTAVTNTGANVDSGPNYQSFQVINENNIFNPNRTRFRNGDRPQRSAPRTVDAFALVGTMSYTKGTFAFFDGSRSQYKKVVEPGANIAGYTVKDITPQAVILAANGKEFEMKVGTQLRNEGANGWRMAEYSDQPVTPEAEGDSAVVQPLVPPTGASPEQSDILKRLMEQRQQELK